MPGSSRARLVEPTVPQHSPQKSGKGIDSHLLGDVAWLVAGLLEPSCGAHDVAGGEQSPLGLELILHGPVK